MSWSRQFSSCQQSVSLRDCRRRAHTATMAYKRSRDYSLWWMAYEAKLKLDNNLRQNIATIDSVKDTESSTYNLKQTSATQQEERKRWCNHLDYTKASVAGFDACVVFFAPNAKDLLSLLPIIIKIERPLSLHHHTRWAKIAVALMICLVVFPFFSINRAKRSDMFTIQLTD
jgi:hypothetical protein